MTTDEQLMLEFQRGSRDAFTELFTRYRDRIYAFFRRRVLQPARAEELAQETFLAVIHSTARYEPRALVRTWLYGIATNLWLAEQRKAAHESPVGDDPPEVAAPDCATDTALWVRAAIAQLNADQREVLLLREYEQLSYGEIAELQHVPVNTVRSRLFRARIALKSLLAPENEREKVP